MKRNIVCAAILITVLLASVTALGQGRGIRKLAGATALEKELLKDASDGELDDFSTVEAGFIASGVPTDTQLDRYRKRYAALLDDIKEHTKDLDDDYAVAQATFKYLHKHLLKRYGLHAVDLIGLFNNGDYNCVSATVLFNSILQDLNIKSAGVLVPSHAFSIVYTEDGYVEVETTSPHGFNPARTEDEYRKLLKRYRLTGAMYQTSNGKKVARSALIQEIAGTRKVVDNLTMVAVIYSNIAAARVMDGDRASALSLFLKATALAGDNEYFLKSRDAVLNNMIVDLIESADYLRAIAVAKEATRLPNLSAKLVQRIQDWSVYAYCSLAITAEEEGRFEQVIALYDRALADYPGHHLLLHNRKAGYVNWGVALIRAQDYQPACSVLLTGLRLYPADELVHQNFLACAQKYTRNLKEQAKFDHALTVALFALKQAETLVPAANQGYLVPRLHLEVGLVHFARKRYADAAKRFSEGLSTNDEIFANNYSAAVGNLAKDLMDSKDYAQGLSVAQDGLAVLEHYGISETTLWATYWTAAVTHANDLRQNGHAGAALETLLARPLSTLPADRVDLLENFAQILSSAYLDTDQPALCVKLLERVAPLLQDPAWLPKRAGKCRELAP